MNVWLGWYTTERLCPEALPGEVDDATKCAMLREIFPNPFRVVFVLEHWLDAGGTGAVARAIYDERRFADLPVLADALEDAGCDDPTILRHLRGPGPHVRGCWALDAVLGRLNE